MYLILIHNFYFRLNGSYEAIDGGFGTESLEDFSGGIAEEFFTANPPENLYNILLRAHECTALITTGIVVSVYIPLVNREINKVKWNN